MSEFISRTEAGKRLGISRQMITRYVRREMPSDAHGRILWPEAREWYETNIIPQSSGSWAHRQAAKQKPNGFNLHDPYTRGFLDGFRRARKNLRECLPEILSESVGLDIGARVFVLAVFDVLMENWLHAAPDGELQPINWTLFHEEAPEELQKYFDEVQEQHSRNGAKVL